MIDTVVFENVYGERLIPHQRGIWMKYHDAPPPKPKILRFELDGMDGALDMTEWAGETKFESREVTIGFKDMTARFYEELTQFCLGRMVKIMFSDDPNYYFYGRGESDSKTTRRRITDGDITFICDPYRMARAETVFSKSYSNSTSVSLKAKRKSVIPYFTFSKTSTLTWNGTTYSDIPKTQHEISGIVVTDRAATLTVAASGSATVEIKWRDGIL